MELRVGEQTATELPIHLHGASGIAVDSAGAVYVTEGTSDGGLYRLAPGASGPVHMVPGSFNAVAVDASDTIYLTAQIGPPSVLKLYAGQTVPTNAAFGNMNSVTGVAVDTAGNVYVSDGWATALPVYRLAAGRTSATALDVADMGFPNSLARGIVVDNDSNVYVVDDKQNRVIKVRAPLRDAQ
jgi:sugar lactone lactonase YvrE